MVQQAVALTESAIKSAFSEYDVLLMEEYNLLCVNTEYHGEVGGNDSFSEHIREYINECLKNEEKYDFYNIKLKRIDIEDSTYVDQCADVFFVNTDQSNYEYINDTFNTNHLLVSAKIKAVFEIVNRREVYATAEYSLFDIN